MSTELSNGVIIPEEYSDDWYDEMSINLRKLNDVITAASDNATDIQRLDTDKANQSDLTALTSRVSQNETDIIALQTAVSGALKREIVQTLPTEDISTTTIYMIRNSQSSGTNIYDEYMYINSQWELIGTSATDFSNYYTKNETDNLLSGKVDNSTLGSYYTKTESDNLLSAKANQTDLTSLSGRVTQTETDITALQTAVSGALKREIVQTLPTEDISTTTIYMIRNTTTSGDNIYDEYMYINNLWELIGTSATDFSNYYTKTEIDTLLSYKATDSNVVHKSGDETISGFKTFSSPIRSTAYPNIRMYLTDDEWNVQPAIAKQSEIRFTDKNSVIVSYFSFQHRADSNEPFRTCWRQQKMDGTNGYYSINFNNLGNFYPENNNAIDLGGQGNRWKSVYANNYYYGSNNVEFSTKFVTTDTNQTIGGTKDFSDVLRIYNSNSSLNTAQILLKNSKVNRGQSVYGDQAVWFRDVTDKPVTALVSRVTSLGASALLLYVYNVDQNNQQVTNYLSFVKYLDGSCYLLPDQNNVVELGSTSIRLKNLCTNKINGVEPSSLSLPSGNASDFIDISSYFTNTGSGDTNTYTALANGWIYLRLGDISGCQATILDANNNRMWGQSSMGSVEQMTIPILKGQTLSTQWTTGSSVNVATARFIPCLGNI